MHSRTPARASLLAGGMLAATLAIATAGGSETVATAAAPTAAQTGQVCVDFAGVQLLNEDGADSSELLPIELVAGDYQITLVSTDASHATSPDPGQTAEAYKVVSGLGIELARTIDLPEPDVKSVTTVVTTIEVDVFEVRAVHTREAGSLNSVHPGTVCFELQSAAPTTTTTTSSTVAPTTTSSTQAPTTTTSSVPVTTSSEPTAASTTTTVVEPAEPAQLAVTGPREDLLSFLAALAMAMIGFGLTSEWAQRQKRRNAPHPD